MLGRDDTGVPVVVHWGAALGDLDDAALGALVAATRPGVSRSSYDVSRRTGAVPDPTRGFSGTPALAGHRVGGSATASAPSLVDWEVEAGDSSLTCTSVDDEAGWSVMLQVALDEAGLLHARTSVTNTADGDLHLSSVLTALPVPAHAGELLDLTGRWCKERSPQRHPLGPGTHRRDDRRGRTGHDATLLLVAGTPGFGFGAARCGPCTPRGAATTAARRAHPRGRGLLGGGELLGARRDRARRRRALPRAPGCSARGRRRASTRWPPVPRPPARGSRPRARPSARSSPTRGRRSTSTTTSTGSPRSPTWRPRVGVERFVLDDGWFLGRRDDTAGPRRLDASTRRLAARPRPARRARARPRHGVRPLGRARDGQPRLRARPRAPRLGAARPARRCRRSGATSRCSTCRTPTRTPTCATR